MVTNSFRVFLSVALCLAVFVLAPISKVEAIDVESSGISPPFEPGTSWERWVGFLDAGDILWWQWSSASTLNFSVYTSPNSAWFHDLGSYRGFFVETPGNYILWWYNDGLSNATVNYWVHAFTPTTTVTTPTSGEYLDSRTMSVQGTYDGYAKGILVGPDVLHLRKAVTSDTHWGIDDFDLEDGANDIMVRSYYWLDHYGNENYTVDRHIGVYVDTVRPEVTIAFPREDGNVRGNYVDIGWQCTDDCGIAETEMKIDGWEWNAVNGTAYNDLELGTGEHTVRVRVTDLAGNQYTDSVTFTVDARALSFDGPYYGLPVIGIILGLVIVATALIVRFRRRRGGAAVTTIPKKDTTPESA